MVLSWAKPEVGSMRVSNKRRPPFAPVQTCPSTNSVSELAAKRVFAEPFEHVFFSAPARVRVLMCGLEPYAQRAMAGRAADPFVRA